MRSAMVAALFLLGFGPSTTHAQAAGDAPHEADAARVAALVKQLGDNEFTAREAASDELAEIGLPAFTALEAAGRHPDREIRYRSQRILGQIRQLDQERRLEAFLSGKDDADDYPLPGWSRFQKAYGDDATSRSLFVEMQRADAELLKALEQSPQAAADALTLRLAQTQQALQTGVQTVSSGQAAATLFVAGEEDVVLTTQARSMVLNQCAQPSYRDLLNNSSRKAIARKMLGSTIVRSEDWAGYMAMQISIQYSMKEGLVPALTMLNNPANRTMTQYALATVAKLGDQSHLPAVEKLLDDKTVVNKMKQDETVDGKTVEVEYEMQVRDAALATAILLRKEKLTDFFDIPQEQRQLLVESQIIYYNPRLIGFSSEDGRTRVFEKWTKFKAKQPVDEAQPGKAPE
jgi:hypothetical protein